MSKKDDSDRISRLTQSMDKMVKAAKKTDDHPKAQSMPELPTVKKTAEGSEMAETAEAVAAHIEAKENIRRGFALDPASLKRQLEELAQTPGAVDAFGAILFGQMTTYMKKIREAKTLDGTNQTHFDVIRLLVNLDPRLATAFFREIAKVTDAVNRAKIIEGLISRNIITEKNVIEELRKPFDPKQVSILGECILQGVVSKEAVLGELKKPENRELLGPVLGQLIGQGVFDLKMDREELESFMADFPATEIVAEDPIAAVRMLILLHDYMSPKLSDGNEIHSKLTEICKLAKNPEARKVLINGLVNPRFSMNDKLNYDGKLKRLLDEDEKVSGVKFTLDEVDYIKKEILSEGKVRHFSNAAIEYVDEAMAGLHNEMVLSTGGSTINITNALDDVAEKSQKVSVMDRVRHLFFMSFIGFGLKGFENKDKLGGKDESKAVKKNPRFFAFTGNTFDEKLHTLSIQMQSNLLGLGFYHPWSTTSNRGGLSELGPLEVSAASKIVWSRALNPFFWLQLGLRGLEVLVYKATSLISGENVGRSMAQFFLIGLLRIPQLVLNPLSNALFFLESKSSPINDLLSAVNKENGKFGKMEPSDIIKNWNSEDYRKYTEYDCKIASLVGKLGKKEEADYLMKSNEVKTLISLRNTLLEYRNREPKSSEDKRMIKLLEKSLDARLPWSESSRPPLESAKKLLAGAFIGFGLEKPSEFARTSPISTRWLSVTGNPFDDPRMTSTLPEMIVDAFKEVLFQPWVIQSGTSVEPLTVSTTSKLNWGRMLNPFIVLTLALKVVELSIYRATSLLMDKENPARSVVQAILIGFLRLPQIVIQPLANLTKALTKVDNESPISSLQEEVKRGSTRAKAQDGLNKERGTTRYDSRIEAYIDDKSACDLIGLRNTLLVYQNIDPKNAQIKRSIKILEQSLKTSLRVLERVATPSAHADKTVPLEAVSVDMIDSKASPLMSEVNNAILRNKIKAQSFTVGMDLLNNEKKFDEAALRNFMNSPWEFSSLNTPETTFDDNIVAVVRTMVWYKQVDKPGFIEKAKELIALRNALVEFEQRSPQTKFDKQAIMSLRGKIESGISSAWDLINSRGEFDMPQDSSTVKMKKLMESDYHAATQELMEPKGPPTEVNGADGITWLNIQGDKRDWRHDRRLNEVKFTEVELDICNQLSKQLASQLDMRVTNAGEIYQIRDKGIVLAEVEIRGVTVIARGFTPKMLERLGSELSGHPSKPLSPSTVSIASRQLHNETVDALVGTTQDKLDTNAKKKSEYSIFSGLIKFVGYLTNKIAAFIPGTNAYSEKQAQTKLSLTTPSTAKESDFNQIESLDNPALASRSTTASNLSLSTKEQLSSGSNPNVEPPKAVPSVNKEETNKRASILGKRTLEQMDSDSTQVSNRRLSRPFIEAMTVTVRTTIDSPHSVEDIQSTLANFEGKAKDNRISCNLTTENAQPVVEIRATHPDQSASEVIREVVGEISSKATVTDITLTGGRHNDQDLVKVALKDFTESIKLAKDQEESTKDSAKPSGPTMGSGSNE